MSHGTERAQVLRRALLFFVAQGSRRSLLTHLVLCRRKDDPVTTELQLRLHDGTLLPAELHNRVALNSTSESRYQSTVVDLIERKRDQEEWQRMAHAEARAMNEAKDEFLAILSHELRERERRSGIRSSRKVLHGLR